MKVTTLTLSIVTADSDKQSGEAKILELLDVAGFEGLVVVDLEKTQEKTVECPDPEGEDVTKLLKWTYTANGVARLAALPKVRRKELAAKLLKVSIFALPNNEELLRNFELNYMTYSHENGKWASVADPDMEFDTQIEAYYFSMACFDDVVELLTK